MAIFLIVFLLYMMLSNKSGGGLKQILSDIDLETVKPLLSLFGLDESALDALSGENLQDLLNGNGDILSLIKTLLPIISAAYSAIKGFGGQENALQGDSNGYGNGNFTDSSFADNGNFGNPTASYGAGNCGEYSGGNNNRGFSNIGGGFNNGGFSNTGGSYNGYNNTYDNGGNSGGRFNADPPDSGGLNPVKDLLSPDNLSDLEECFSI